MAALLLGGDNVGYAAAAAAAGLDALAQFVGAQLRMGWQWRLNSSICAPDLNMGCHVLSS